MRLSCLPVSLYPELASGHLTVGDWFRTAASLGLDGSDLSVAHVVSRSPAHLDELERQAAEAGVLIAMLATYTDFTHPSADERARQVDDLRRWIDAAARLGAAMIRVTAGQARPDVSETAGLDWAVAGLTSCLDQATRAGIRLLFENHVRGSIWTQNDFTQPGSRFLEIVRRTDATPLGILFDTANSLALAEDPVVLFDQIKDRVGAVHLSDLRCAGTFEPVALGSGVAPIGPLLRRIVARGFDDWISIEEASRTGPDAFRAAVAFADRAWVSAGGSARRQPHQ